MRLSFAMPLFALAACGDPSPPAATSAAPAAAAPAASLEPATADARAAAANTAPAAAASAADPTAAVAATSRIFAAVAGGDLAAQGRAPQELAALGAGALPALQDRLANGALAERRVAVLALLQLGTAAAPSTAALLAARNDPDPAVRAAAEHAYRRAIDDRSELERLRAQDAAARAGH